MKERISNWLYNNWGYILQFIGISMMLISLMFLFSCNPVKKVLADIDKVKEVRTATDALFPCNSDTLFTTKTDTVTTYDTLTDVRTITVQDTVTNVETKIITKTVRIRDTTFITTDDDREEKRLQGDLQTAINYQIQYLNEASKAKDKYEEERKAKNLFKWLLYGLVLLLSGLVVYKIWPKPVKRLTDNLKLN